MLHIPISIALNVTFTYKQILRKQQCKLPASFVFKIFPFRFDACAIAKLSSSVNVYA